MIVDWTPVSVYIEATDAAGNSIISPVMPGMSLTFKGETYTVQQAREYPEIVQTKAYLPVMFGLVAEKVSGTDELPVYRLVFGEIDGAADMDEDIELNWPDGSKDVIHYHCSNHREWPEPDCDRSWKLNGKKHEGAVFKFSGKSVPAFLQD